MFSAVRDDIRTLRQELKGQDLIFYLGLGFVVLYYLRPQVIISGLDIIPWLQITILGGLVAMVVNSRLKLTGTHFLVFLFTAWVFLSAQNSLYPETSFRQISVRLIFAIEVLFLSKCV